MGESKNRINVTINDQHFTITGEDSSEHIRYVVHLADEEMQELGQKSTGLGTTREAISASVNITYEKTILEEENGRLQQEISQLKQRDG